MFSVLTESWALKHLCKEQPPWLYCHVGFSCQTVNSNSTVPWMTLPEERRLYSLVPSSPFHRLISSSHSYKPVQVPAIESSLSTFTLHNQCKSTSFYTKLISVDASNWTFQWTELAVWRLRNGNNLSSTFDHTINSIQMVSCLGASDFRCTQFIFGQQ